MEHWRHGAIIFILTSLVVLAGCGGGNTYTPDPGPGGGNQVPTGTWQGTAANSAVENPGIVGVPDIPPDKATASRAASAEENQFVLLGSEYLQKYNAEVDGTKLVLNAPLEAGDGEYPIAYGLYKFADLLDYDLQSLNIECLPAVFGMEYFVGVADYTLGDWLWFGPVTFPEFQLDLSDLEHQFVSELGNMYFIVVCEAGNSATISKSTLTVATGGGEEPGLPGPPHGLIATDGVYTDKVVLEWEPGSEAGHYEIWRRASADGEWDDLAVEDGTRYEDHAVDSGHIYWYKVRSVNEQGKSEWSNVDSGYAGEGGGEPGTPFELWASDGTYENYVRVEWGYEGDYSHFDLWRKQDGEGYEWHHLAYTEGMAYNDEAVDTGVVYIYKVRALLGEHEGAFSNTDSGYAGGGGGEAPPAPWDLVASDGTYEDHVALEWNYEIEGAGFDVYRKLFEHEGSEWTVIGETSNHYYHDLAVDPEVVYIYKVVAWVEGEQSEPSNTDTGYAASGGGGLNPPFELWASDGNYETKVRLEWGHEGDYGYFEVWRKQDGEGYEWHKIGQTEAKSYDDFEVDAGVVYIYKVRAMLGEMESEFSNTDSGYASGGGGGVNAPFELWATDGAHSDRVVASWSHEGDYSYFDVWRKRDGEGYEWGRIGTTEAMHYIDMEVDPGVVYIYKARAILGEQESEWSNTDSGYASEGWTPPAPWELWATDGEYTDKVVVFWSYEFEGAAFDVYRKLHQEGAEWGVIGETQDHAYHDFDVDAGVVYDYKVVAWVDGSHSEPSNIDSGYAAEGGGPEAPWGLIATDGLYTDKVRTEWGYEGEYNHFDLWRKRDGEAYEWEHLANTEIPEYNDFAVDAGVTYWYKVRVIVGEQESEFSNHDSGYASGGGEVPAPFELSASDGTYSGYVRIDWGYEGEYSHFDLWRKRDGEGYEWAHIAYPEGLHWLDDNVDVGVVYIYKVRAIVGEQASEFSNTDSGYAGDGGGPE